MDEIGIRMAVLDFWAQTKFASMSDNGPKRTYDCHNVNGSFGSKAVRKFSASACHKPTFPTYVSPSLTTRTFADHAMWP